MRQGDSWGYPILRPPVKGIFDDPINVAWLRGTIGYQRAGGDFHGLTPVGGFTLCLYPCLLYTSLLEQELLEPLTPFGVLPPVEVFFQRAAGNRHNVFMQQSEACLLYPSRCV